MRRRSRAGGESATTRRRETVTRKRGNAPKTVHRRSSSVADLQEQLDHRTCERDEAQEQQAATAEVLKVISSSTFNLTTVLNTVAETAARLCEAEMANIWQPKDNVYRLTASYNEYAESKEFLETVAIKPGRGTIVGRSLLKGKTIHVHDVRADPEYIFVKAQQLGGFRTVLAVPMLRENVAIGVLAGRRPRSAAEQRIATSLPVSNQCNGSDFCRPGNHWRHGAVL